MIDEETQPEGTPAEEPTTAPEASETTEAPAAEAAAEQPVAEAGEAPAAEAAPAADAATEDDADEEVDETPRVKPAIPGADLEVDIVEEGADPFSGESDEDEDGSSEDDDEIDHGPITTNIELAADARYRATGKRKTAVARVTLKPGTGKYTINGKDVDVYFPRATLQRVLRQPLEVVALDEKVDVVAAIHGGGVAAQAGALRHGISRAILEADPSLRTELKRRGFLTRDARVKERKKAGLKKARKRPQFSKR